MGTAHQVEVVVVIQQLMGQDRQEDQLQQPVKELAALAGHLLHNHSAQVAGVADHPQQVLTHQAQ